VVAGGAVVAGAVFVGAGVAAVVRDGVDTVAAGSGRTVR
jgi:hypothetical protein